jgi:hypothetical protein
VDGGGVVVVDDGRADGRRLVAPRRDSARHRAVQRLRTVTGERFHLRGIAVPL